jgi:hypothetical protein
VNFAVAQAASAVGPDYKNLKKNFFFKLSTAKCKKIESKSELLSLQGLNVSTREDRFGFDFCRFTAIYTQILETHGNS